jgi:hypothetical protein
MMTTEKAKYSIERTSAATTPRTVHRCNFDFSAPPFDEAILTSLAGIFYTVRLLFFDGRERQSGFFHEDTSLKLYIKFSFSVNAPLRGHGTIFSRGFNVCKRDSRIFFQSFHACR